MCKLWYNLTMDKKLTSICKYLDEDNFNNATEEELKSSLQNLSNYFATLQGRKKIILKYDEHTLINKMKNNNDVYSCNASTYVDDILLIPSKPITEYMSYLSAFDCVIHENFHQFEYYLSNLPKNFVDEIMWQRIVSYNIYFYSTIYKDYEFYRFNDFELDAYRYTDFFLKCVCKDMKKNNFNVGKLEIYIKNERNIFLKQVKKLKKKYGKNAKEKIDNFYIDNAMKSILELSETKINEKTLSKKIKNGYGLNSIIDGTEIANVSQIFINLASKNFKQYLPYLYNSSIKNNMLYNENFFEM